METILKKKLTRREMESLFDRTDLINIRYYKYMNGYFHILIRHAENANANKIFSNAITQTQIKTEI